MPSRLRNFFKTKPAGEGKGFFSCLRAGSQRRDRVNSCRDTFFSRDKPFLGQICMNLLRCEIDHVLRKLVDPDTLPLKRLNVGIQKSPHA